MKDINRKNYNEDDESSATTMMDEDQRSVALLLPTNSKTRNHKQNTRNENRTNESSPVIDRWKESETNEIDKSLPLKKRTKVLVSETAVSPATQTLNELNGMDLLEDNLYTQLSQVSYSQALSGGVFGRDDDDCHENDPSSRQRLNKECQQYGDIAAVYDTGYKVMLGTFSKEEANRRKTLAKEAIKHFRNTFGYAKLKDRDWLHAKLEEMGIRDVGNSNAIISNSLTSTSATTKNKDEEKQDDQQIPKTKDWNETIPSLLSNPTEEHHDSDEDGECSDTINSDNTELENIQSYQGEPKVVKRVYYQTAIIGLSSCYQKCAEQRHRRAKRLVQRWKTYKNPPTVEWVKSELQKRGYREGPRYQKTKVVDTRNKPESNEELKPMNEPEQNNNHDISSTRNHQSESEIGSESVPNNNHCSVINTNSNYTTREVTIYNHGPMGFKVRTVSMESVQVCLVTSVEDKSSAQNNDVKVNDVIMMPTGSKEKRKGTKILHTKGKMNTFEGANFATVEDIRSWSESSSRPITFHVLRREDVSPMISKELAIGSETVDISSLNISELEINRAIRGKKVFPTVPCCKFCAGDEKKKHHYLCSKHKNFQTSGAKDILIILLAGIRDKCNACAYEIKTGKKSRSMKHIEKCDRNSNKNGNDKKVSVQLNKTSSKQVIKNPPVEPIMTVDFRKSLPRQKEHHSKQIEQAVIPTSASNKRKKDGNLDSNTPSQTQTNKSVSTKITPARELDPLTSRIDSLNDDVDDNNSLILGDASSEDQWIPCANPWGPLGFCDGDTIYNCPTDYQYRYQIYGDNPKRFIDEPFSNGSTYRDTHIIKETVELRRDAMAQIDWGFEFSYHDFGGACIITKVDPISPAADARIIGDPDQVSSLATGDIILLLNGERVGSKTELDIAVELEVSRSWITLTVAKYTTDSNSVNKRLNWQNLDNVIAFDSHPIAAVASDNASMVSRVSPLTNNQSADTPRKIKENADHNTSDSGNLKWQSSIHKASCTNTSSVAIKTMRTNKQRRDVETTNVDTTNVETTNVDITNEFDPTDNAINKSYSDMEEDYESDENPWLPCICGSDHKSQYESLFWIQCDECEAWYNCAPSCIGHSREEVNDIKRWECPDCNPIPALISPNQSNDKESEENETTETVTPQKRNISDVDKHPFVIGTIVRVDDRSWMPGRYLGGGVAKILRYQKEKDEYLYDVQYIHGGKENSIESEYVAIDHSVDTPRSSRRSGSIGTDGH